MTRRQLITGPRHPELETAAFDRLAGEVGDHPDSILYLARTHHAERPTRQRWRTHGNPLSLRLDTFDGVVAHCHERDHFAGRDAHVDEHLRNRLVELAVERLDDPTNPLACEDRLASTGRCGHVEDLLSLVEFAGLHSPAAIRNRLRAEGLDHQAEHVAAVAAAFHQARDELFEESAKPSLRAERYRQVLERDAPLADRFPAVDAVVLGGFSLFSPLERRLVDRLADDWPTVALLSQCTDTDDAVGVDRGADRARRAFRDLGFEREHVSRDVARTDGVATSRRLYRHAGAAADETATVTASTDVALVQPETVPQELRHVARDVRARIADGATPADLGIVLTDGGAYHERLVETLAQYGVPATLAIERPFAKTALGEVVAELGTLGRDDPPLDAVTALLSNPLVTIGQEDPALDRDDLARLARRLTSRRLAAATPHLDDDAAATIHQLVADAQALRTTTLAALPDEVNALLDRLGVPDAIDVLPDTPRGRTEQQAAETLDRVLETLALTDGVADPDRGDAVDRLDRALGGVTLGGGTAREDGHLLVCDLQHAATRTFDHAYVLGLTADHVPSNPERLAFTRPINEAHEDFAEADLQQRARYHVALLLASDASLTLSVPERALDGDPFVEADVVTELRRVTGMAPEPVATDDAPPGCREDVQRALGRTFARGDVADHAPHVDRAAEAGAFDDVRHRRLQAGVSCAAARASDDLTPHDGQLSPETVAALHDRDDREPYSPSRLETYATCGFKDYMATVLEIGEPDEIGLEPDARDRGGYVHDVLEHYYADLQSAPGEPVEIVADREARENHLLAVALARLDDWFEGDATAFHAEWCYRLLAGLGEPDANPYFGTDRVDAPERGVLVRFLDHEFGDVGAATARPAWFEARVGRSRHGDPLQAEPVVVETPAGDVPIHGMIDRVDVVPGTEPTQVVVRDYKTGSTPSEADTLGGVAFQLPVYAALVEDVLDDVETVGGSYYQVSPPSDVNHRKGLVAGRDNVDHARTTGSEKPLTAWQYPSFETHEEFRGFVETELPSRLGQLAGGITAGHYHPTVLDPDDAGCRYCGYSDACDVRPHRRHGVMDAIDEADASAYVPIAARDEDPAAVLEVE